MKFFRVLHGLSHRELQLSKLGLTSKVRVENNDCQTLEDIFYPDRILRKETRRHYKVRMNYRVIDLTFTDSKSNPERRQWKFTQRTLRGALVYQKHLFIFRRPEISYPLLRDRRAVQQQIWWIVNSRKDPQCCPRVKFGWEIDFCLFVTIQNIPQPDTPLRELV